MVDFMAIPGRTERRGGARPGSGPKRQTLSVRQVTEMLEAAKRKADESGMSVDDILLSFIYDEDIANRDRLAAIKLWKDKTMAPIAEGGETDQQVGVAFYLPEERPDLKSVA